MYIIIKIKT